MKERLVFSLLAATSVLFAAVRCNNITIATATEFIKFSNDVKSGTSYNGTTVFLNADLDFSGVQVNSTGGTNSYFMGCFDGRGHTIRNLAINSSKTEEYTGLFGYTKGISAKNVVLDASCTVSSFYSYYSFAHIGSLIGDINQNNNEEYIIEGIINMGSVTFLGAIKSTVYIGGIIGYVSASETNNVHIKNCANYGSTIYNGSSNNAQIGGITGYSQYIDVANCINYGTVSHNGNTSNMCYIGGISGCSQRAENCVNFGVIQSVNNSHYVGSIIGYISGTDQNVLNCYWSNKNMYNAIGNEIQGTGRNSSSFDTNLLELSRTVTAMSYKGTSLVSALNAIADFRYIRDYSHWAYNKYKKTIAFVVNERNFFTTKSELILLPSLAEEGNTVFDGWYTDKSCTKGLSNYTITTNLTLYAKWESPKKNYTITFDTRGGTCPQTSITAQHLSTIKLPQDTPTKDRHILWHWENDYGEVMPYDFIMPAHNITLHAVWLCTAIITAEEFVEFSDLVNSGATYSGVTITLEADLDFTESLSRLFKPIGESIDRTTFSGSFDGKRHKISNLTMTVSQQNAGLFGYSNGAAIKNIVVDESCSIKNVFNTSYTSHLGGIIGHCYTNEATCLVEGCINMANITASGNVVYYINLGGIVGRIGTNKHNATIKNCVNYGIIQTINAKSTVNIGGIVGEVFVGLITTNANYGAVTHKSTYGTINKGGIAGSTTTTTVRRCVGSGIVTPSNETTDGSVGGIVGSLSTSSNITNCIWEKTPEINVPCVIKYNSFVDDFSNKTSSLNASSLRGLNKDAEINKESLMVLLHLDGGNVNGYSKDTLAVPQEKLPVPVKDGHAFCGWWADENFTVEYGGSTHNSTDAYAQFVVLYTVTFVWNTTYNETSEIMFNSTIQYPENVTLSGGQTLTGWVLADGTTSLPVRMPAYNMIFFAKWESPATVTSEYVEVTFGAKNLTKKQAEEEIKKYTKEDFFIERFEKNETTGETIAIIRFESTEKANDFVRSVEEQPRSTDKSLIKRVKSVEIKALSLSPRNTAVLPLMKTLILWAIASDAFYGLFFTGA